MPMEERPVKPATVSQEGVSADPEIVSATTNEDPDDFPGQTECLRPTASAKGEGKDSNTLNLYTLDFAASCVRHFRPVGYFRFIECFPSGRPSVEIASNRPTRVILQNDPQNHALTNWRDVAIRINSRTLRECVASLYISDIPGTENMQVSLLVTRGDSRGDPVVYCFSGVLSGRLNVLRPESCGSENDPNYHSENKS